MTTAPALLRSNDTPPSDAQARRPRVPAAERERSIVSAAILFFAEEGFEGQVRELAKRIGVKHSVLFRHFATKDALIERVYQEVYLSRWRPEWEGQLQDPALPLEERLLRFYQNYTSAIFGPDWTRIFLFAGLKGVPINARYLQLVRDHVLLPICGELRRDSGLPQAPVSAAELELAWGLHGKIFYIAIRAFVYGMAVPVGDDRLLRDAVQTFLKGVGSTCNPNRHAAAVGPADALEKTEPNDTSAFLCREASAISRSQDPATVRGPAEAPCPRPGPSRKRMRPDEREAAILAEAVHFFAEHGMDGQMRELARRLGVTHPLLYRYFPTKEALIERVYEDVYLRPWDESWDSLLHDRDRPLRDRLAAFYRAYFQAIDRYEWIRIFMFSALRDVGISTRYLDRVRTRVIEPIAAELRLAPGESLADARELVWGLHGQIIYMAIRRWIYRTTVAEPSDRIITATVDAFFDGAPATLRGFSEE